MDRRKESIKALWTSDYVTVISINVNITHKKEITVSSNKKVGKSKTNNLSGRCTQVK